MAEHEPRFDAAAAARRINRSLVATTIPDAEAALLAAELERIADRLEPYDRASRYDDPEATAAIPFERDAGKVVLHEDDEIYRSHPVVGRWHPLAPPLTMTDVGERPVAEAAYGVAYEGFPGIVHGGFIALAFDYITVLAAFLNGFRGMTGSLQVKYRKPVPLGTDLRYEAWVEKASGRASIAKAELTGPDGLYAQAETLVIGAKA